MTETVFRDQRAAANGEISISIIVPCWRDDSARPEMTAGWLRCGAVREVLIASAAPETSPPTPEPPGVRVIHCSRAGRGHQLNEAARVATGDILLFHHVDTELTEAHLESLKSAMSVPATGGGAFRRQFDERHPYLRWLEPWEALRCRLFGPLFGDQSIFVRRQVFNKIGGFAEIPLMEDVDLSCRLRRGFPIVVLEPSIRSSARKHLQQGAWRTTCINALMLFMYVCGVPPRSLHARYYQRVVPTNHNEGRTREG